MQPLQCKTSTTSSRTRLARRVTAIGFALIALGCSTEEPTNESADIAVAGASGFEDFKESLRYDSALGLYFHEDMHFDEDELRNYYDAMIEMSTALTIDPNSSGKPSRQSVTQRTNLSYCVSSTFTATQRTAIQSAMNTAAAAWESTIPNINFIDSTPSGGCTDGSTSVYFDIRKDPACTDANGATCTFGTAGCGCDTANSFFPSAGSRSARFIMLQRNLWGGPGGALLTHELGHTLGFRHEWNNASATLPVGCTTESAVVSLTGFDVNSVMAYPTATGAACGTSAGYAISQLDGEGARCVYSEDRLTNGVGYCAAFGANVGSGLAGGKSTSAFVILSGRVMAAGANPGAWTSRGRPGGLNAISIVAGGGKLFAVASSGDIYRWTSGTSWSVVGGAGAQFVVAHDGQLFALNPNKSAVFRWSGSGTSWSSVGGAANRLFAGSNTVFATTPDEGQIWKWSGSGSTWSQVGGSGANYVTDHSGTLYGLTGSQEIWKYSGSGTSWTRIRDASLANASNAIYAGRTLFARNANTGSIVEYNKSANTFRVIGGARVMETFVDTGTRYFGSAVVGTTRFIYEYFRF